MKLRDMEPNDMTADNIIRACIDQYSEEVVQDMVIESMYDYVDEDDIEDHGGVVEAYEEIGRGGAESQVLMDILEPVRDVVSIEVYCEVTDRLCDTWHLSID